ncbi:MAG: hypothetical protein HC869_02800 [Rhodospirillales bacterium]|nr:hypothetical protein [Rhodospirillales bacterium]
MGVPIAPQCCRRVALRGFCYPASENYECVVVFFGGATRGILREGTGAPNGSEQHNRNYTDPPSPFLAESSML